VYYFKNYGGWFLMNWKKKTKGKFFHLCRYFPPTFYFLLPPTQRKILNSGRIFFIENIQPFWVVYLGKLAGGMVEIRFPLRSSEVTASNRERSTLRLKEEILDKHFMVGPTLIKSMKSLTQNRQVSSSPF